MNKSRELRQRAVHYRWLMMGVTDARAVQVLRELADESERRAETLETSCRIRERAYRIWIERGCPEGRDLEHWLLAERDLAGDGQST
jgi:hypothetical protein